MASEDPPPEHLNKGHTHRPLCPEVFGDREEAKQQIPLSGVPAQPLHCVVTASVRRGLLVSRRPLRRALAAGRGGHPFPSGAGAESRVPCRLQTHPPSDWPGAAGGGGGFRCPCSRVSRGSRLEWRGPTPRSLPLSAVGSEPSPPLAVTRNSFSPSNAFHSERKRGQESVPPCKPGD